MFIIKNSPIHGQGLFLSIDASSNIKLYEYVCIEMSWIDFTEKYGSYKENSLNTYPMRRIHKIICAKEEPYKTQNLINYINESNNPNCILKNKSLYSIREIKANEELTLKYPKDYKRNYTIPLEKV